MITLYIFIGSLVAIAYGINLTWRLVDVFDSEDTSMIYGPAIGIALGVFWPVTLFWHFVGWLGIKARKNWLKEQE